jgi:replicative DNA helicase
LSNDPKENLFSYNTEMYIIKVMYNRPDTIVELAQKLNPDDFYYKPFRHLFGGIKRLSAQGDVTAEGILTLLENENKEGFDMVSNLGGISAIEGLRDNSLPSSPAVSDHIKTLKSFNYRRKAVDVANSIINFVTTNNNPQKQRQFEGVDEIDDEIKTSVYSLAEAIKVQNEVKKIGSSSEQVLAMLRDKTFNGIDISGHFRMFNLIIKGLRNKALYVFGAAEKVGKSTFMLDIAWYVARVLRRPVAYADTEMTEEEVLLRLWSKESGVPEDTIVEGNFASEHQRNVFLEAVKTVEDVPFYHFNANQLTNNELESKVKLLQLQFGIELFIYDYVKIQSHEAEKGRLDMIMAAKIDTLKEKIAKDCNIPVVTSGQMRYDQQFKRWKFAETSHFTKLGDVIGVLALNDPSDEETRLGTHYFKLLMGRKVNRKDSGKEVCFEFSEGTHRIKEIG